VLGVLAHALATSSIYMMSTGGSISNSYRIRYPTTISGVHTITIPSAGASQNFAIDTVVQTLTNKTITDTGSTCRASILVTSGTDMAVSTATPFLNDVLMTTTSTDYAWKGLTTFEDMLYVSTTGTAVSVAISPTFVAASLTGQTMVTNVAATLFSVSPAATPPTVTYNGTVNRIVEVSAYMYVLVPINTMIGFKIVQSGSVTRDSPIYHSIFDDSALNADLGISAWIIEMAPGDTLVPHIASIYSSTNATVSNIYIGCKTTQ
jgi:hypothetical protein